MLEKYIVDYIFHGGYNYLETDQPVASQSPGIKQRSGSK
jgi:hypothetical protein